MSSQCPGCLKTFTSSGLANHLAQTHQPACISARDAAHHSRSVPSPSAPSLPDDFDMDADPIPFEGDYFGTYSDVDFDDDPPSDSGSDPEDDDEFEDEVDMHGWEPPLRCTANVVAGQPAMGPVAMDDMPEDPAGSASDQHLTSQAERRAAEATFRKTRNTFIVPFPIDTAGTPIPPTDLSTETIERVTYQHYQKGLDGSDHNPYAPFSSHRDWEVARWAKMRGPGSTAFSDLLAIEGVAQLLNLSFKTARQLNAIIDKKLPNGRPHFQREEIVVAGEAFEVFFRNILECIRALYGDPEFTPLLLLVPEKHYTDETKSERVYFDMHTGKWWWATQKELEKEKPGATVIPVIISSDKTQLTLFGNKSAYPVYMTIGNLPKDIRSKPSRRGQILLAYLPTTRLQHIKSKAARRRTLANLFHACMTHITAPLVTAGLDGIEIASGDGVFRRGHPILAVYVGDYPEQVLVTGCKTGKCPKCPIPRDELGDDTDTSRPFRDFGKVLDALAAADEGPRAFTRACREAGIKPLYHPFWESLPYMNIYYAITPDILHQLYQGVVKHLIGWLQKACGADEIDARCRRMPRNNSLRHFSKGISCMSRVSGKEHRDMCRVLPGLILGLPLPGGASPTRLLRATKALLDFLYFAQYPTHHTSSLKLLDKALQAFHANKQIFVDLGIRDTFRLPKLHSLDHYRVAIEMFGTTDNYDTQYSERLHIDFTKDAYRASNCKDELPQMTQWLERREKILRHEKYIAWCLRSSVRPDGALAVARPPVLLENGSCTQPTPTSTASSSRTITTTSVSESSSSQPFAARVTPLPSAPTVAAAAVSVPIRRAPGRPRDDPASPRPRIQMTRHPSVKGVKFPQLVTTYGATFFRDALSRYVVEHNHPQLTRHQVEQQASKVFFNFYSVPVFHKIKIHVLDSEGLGLQDTDKQDVVHVRPARKNKYDDTIPGRFDTVLVRTADGNHSGDSPRSIHDFQVAQVRLIFKIPDKGMAHLFPRIPVSERPSHLAYVEWFSKFGRSPHRDHGLYKVTRAIADRRASIIPVDRIERSCHLFPEFGPVAPREWTSSNVLEKCGTFYLNARLNFCTVTDAIFKFQYYAASTGYAPAP
ncbi:hypothetical protein GSI_05801 [Ganoderma sinense ZZ0214-1]|uniref:C2H2-type domain-containing protein n=1 Tax=Ganoderma sinense ZZ0214-1 TaxID=1077348 RepID=A0A2G8SBF8_9APHY|nr:hypothetical protein GSI_05801 [Ganoderma sinense ZZ0214-1]